MSAWQTGRVLLYGVYVQRRSTPYGLLTGGRSALLDQPLSPLLLPLSPLSVSRLLGLVPDAVGIGLFLLLGPAHRARAQRHAHEAVRGVLVDERVRHERAPSRVGNGSDASACVRGPPATRARHQRHHRECILRHPAHVMIAEPRT